MKTGFFLKTAWGNIKKNYRFFIPRILAEAGLLGCFYIAYTLACDGRLAHIKGGEYIPTFMLMAVAILGGLSFVLLLYTNSFLMKQRKQEFGLYNVLGMEKKHVGRVLFHESVLCGIISVLLGLVVGVLFYKACSLLICKLLKAEIIVGFYFIKASTLLPSALIFLGIDLFIFIVNRINIGRMKPVDLLKSRQRGEKEPKVKWVMLVFGLAALVSGYVIALTTKSPLAALGMFFLAVVLVIIGTYFLFVTGSTFILKTLKKSKKYYYKKDHMVAVSGLLYRMKQNAVGLASIAILSTGVLVMMSTTTSLYSGLQGTLDKNFPQHFYAQQTRELQNQTWEDIPMDVVEKNIRQAAEENGVKVVSAVPQQYLTAAYLLKDATLYAEPEYEGFIDFSDIGSWIFITQETYEYLTGQSLGLIGNQVAACRISSPISKMTIPEGEISIHGTAYEIKTVLNSFPISGSRLTNAVSVYGMVLSGEEAFQQLYANHTEVLGEHASEVTRLLAVTFDNKEKIVEIGPKLQKDFEQKLDGYVKSLPDGTGRLQNYIDSYWEARESLLGMYGTLLFLGILLGAVCLFAEVLIIYYKQISEGYEDRQRYRIMEKIGMSQGEVKKTIRSQVLLVFLLPLIAAGIHIAFAYPMLTRILNVLMLYDPTLFLTMNIITYVIFAVVYILIYLGTSRTYYKIVH